MPENQSTPPTPEPAEGLHAELVRLLEEALEAARAGEFNDAFGCSTAAQMSWEDAGRPDSIEDIEDAA